MEYSTQQHAATRLELLEAAESVPGCGCLMCRLYPITQQRFDSLHPVKECQ